MLDAAYYLVTEDIARRSGVIGHRYIVDGNKYVLDRRDLSSVRLTAEEYVTGLQGVERISRDEALRLISQGQYTRGEEPDDTSRLQEEEEVTNWDDMGSEADELLSGESSEQESEENELSNEENNG